VPIEPRAAADFASFGSITSVDKVQACRKLLELEDSLTDIASEGPLGALPRELNRQGTDLAAMKPMLFPIHCDVKTSDPRRALAAAAAFTNR